MLVTESKDATQLKSNFFFKGSSHETTQLSQNALLPCDKFNIIAWIDATTKCKRTRPIKARLLR